MWSTAVRLPNFLVKSCALIRTSGETILLPSLITAHSNLKLPLQAETSQSFQGKNLPIPVPERTAKKERHANIKDVK
jgi:hypothetical protein